MTGVHHKVGPGECVHMKLMTSVTGAALSAVLVVTAQGVVATSAAAAGGVADGSAVAVVETMRGEEPAPDGEARHAATAVALSVAPATGASYQRVTLSVVVTADRLKGLGDVTIRDGATVVARGIALDHGVAVVVTNTLGPGRHVLTAELAPTPTHAGSTSSQVSVSYGTDDTGGDQSGTARQTVVVTIPTGSLSITTPYIVGRPLDLGPADLDQSTSTFAAGARIDGIAVTDTRAGNQGFAASVSSSRFTSSNGDSFGAARAGFVDVAADQVEGNAMRASDVRVVQVPPRAPGLGPARVFASYPAGISVGTVRLHGRLVVTGVPSSVRSGQYRATLTFTAF